MTEATAPEQTAAEAAPVAQDASAAVPAPEVAPEAAPAVEAPEVPEVAPEDAFDEAVASEEPLADEIDNTSEEEPAPNANANALRGVPAGPAPHPRTV